MPGSSRCRAKAGTAGLFNCYGWHTALINRTTTPRKSLISSYCVFNELKDQYGKRGPEWTQSREKLKRLLSPEREYLFGFGRIPEQ